MISQERSWYIARLIVFLEEKKLVIKIVPVQPNITAALSVSLKLCCILKINWVWKR